MENPNLRTKNSLFAGHLWGTIQKPFMSGAMYLMNARFIKKVDLTRYRDNQTLWKAEDVYLGWAAADIDDITYYDLGVYYFGHGYQRRFNPNCHWLLKHKTENISAEPWTTCVFKWSKVLL
eukprot:TRINITY_DN1323_c0_g1_i2.p2 TRINITY_DN1323_c0_g1~~TRINITY_DN1323_c0_g1_i2.p2  ORF type:complete len:121 (-),score=16.33 TRINITY_DN1323_c0_g1_i2:139-501(-)